MANKGKVVNVNGSPQEFEIDPLRPATKTIHVWNCYKCGKKHKSYHKPQIFDMTENGLRIAECLKNI